MLTLYQFSLLVGGKLLRLNACPDIENQNLKIVEKNYPLLKNLILADCPLDGRKRKGVLIGAENYYRFIYGNIIRGKIHELVAVESSFGWLVISFLRT